jgi:hypothetical protein
MTPMQRDREVWHKVVVRYIKAAGFRQIATNTNALQSFKTRKSNRTPALTLDYNKSENRYTLCVAGIAPMKTRTPESVLLNIERLIEEHVERFENLPLAEPTLIRAEEGDA